MSLFNYLIWTADPDIFSIPLSLIGLEDRPVRWYGLLFALGFIVSQQVMYYIYKKEGKSEKDVDTITTYMIIATLLGARLGHCLFYNPGYYLSNPIEILKIWEGGLASHGGAVGIFIALWIYVNYEIKSKWLLIIPTSFSIKKVKREGQNYLWLVDRLVIVTALTGAMIRIGNFMNSEMEGVETKSDLGVIYGRATIDLLNYSEKVDFVKIEENNAAQIVAPGYVPVKAIVTYQRGIELDNNELNFINTRLSNALRTYSEVNEHIDFGSGPLQYKTFKKGGITSLEIYGTGIVRHPAQLYEAFFCIFLMILLFYLWKFHRNQFPDGFRFALFMILLWAFRFVDEFFKMNQEAFEDEIPLNMGQWLSIPLFTFGVLVMIYIYSKKKNSQ